MDSELEKYKDDLAKQQLIVTEAFTRENDLRKVLDKVKQVCTTLVYNCAMTYLSVESTRGESEDGRSTRRKTFAHRMPQPGLFSHLSFSGFGIDK